MDGSDSIKKKQPGKFWLGLLLSSAGWAIDIAVVNLIYSLGIYSDRNWEHFSIFTGLTGVFGILLAVIWLPVAVIAGFRCRKKGLKGASDLLVITSIIAPILIGCGFSALAAYYG